ncbi:MAG: sensor domain-containing diguanylate cyclase [Burkholderiaceae bacterium]|nr:sensor domain-containing diguanylate cyclase [Burkholderiaceae bacterium]
MGTPAEARFDKITRCAAEITDMPMAALDLVGEKLAWLKSVYGFHGIEGLRKDSYCHHTVLGNEICVIRDARTDPRVFDSKLAQIWVFYAGVPLRFENQQVGVLCVGDSKARDLSPEKLKALRDLASDAERELRSVKLSNSQIALAGTGDELDMSARIDLATHGWNRNAIMELLTQEFRGTLAGSEPIGLLMAEIDHFGGLAEKYGRAAADEFLLMTAIQLRAYLKSTDSLGRYADNQFMAVLPGLTGKNMTFQVEAIRRAVSKMNVQIKGAAILLSCSLGCAVSQGGESRDQLIKRATQDLYRAGLWRKPN